MAELEKLAGGLRDTTEIAALKEELAQARARITELVLENVAHAQEAQAFKAKLRAMLEHDKKIQSKTGKISFQTKSAVLKCLHPDQRDNVSEADRDKACRLFTQFLKAEKDKA